MGATLRAVEEHLPSPVSSIPDDLHSYLLLRATGIDDIREFGKLVTSRVHERIVIETVGNERYLPGGEWIVRGHTSRPRADESLHGRQARTLHEKLNRVAVENWMKSMYDISCSPKGDSSDASPLLAASERFVVVDLPHRQVAKITKLVLEGLSAEGRKEKGQELARTWNRVVEDFIECLDALRSGKRSDVRRLRNGFKVVFIGMSVAELAYWQQVDRVLYNLVVDSKREAWRQMR